MDLKKGFSFVHHNLQHSLNSEHLQGQISISDNSQEQGLKCVIESSVIFFTVKEQSC